MAIIINVEELKEMIREKMNLAIVDVRAKTKEFASGEKAYEHSHLPGALFLDIKEDLSGESTFLPHTEKLAEKLGQLGIQDDSVIVLYDQGNHRAASKAWAVLHYLGHEKIHILDGGFKSWINSENEVTNVIPKLKFTTYHAQPRKEFVVDIDYVKNKLSKKASRLIDSRAPDRFIGKLEPKYKKAGHIPGAKNYHAKLVFENNGTWKDKEHLSEHFSKLEKKDEIMVSCGSGNSACMNVVALKEAGFKDVKLYPGGFGEWIEDERNEIEQGEGK